MSVENRQADEREEKLKVTRILIVSRAMDSNKLQLDPLSVTFLAQNTYQLGPLHLERALEVRLNG